MRKFDIYILAALFITSIVFLVKIAKEYEPEFYVKNIVIDNNKIVPTEILLEFIGISDKNDISKLNAEVIIDRIEKHPYIKKAEGIFVDSTTLKVIVYEVEPFVLVATGNGNFILTKDRKLIPEDIRLRIIDLPLLTFADLSFKSRKVNDELIKNAFESFYNIYKTDVALFEIISELNINGKREMFLYLTKPKGKIVIGKLVDKKKAVYLSEFWRKVILQNQQENYEYIDLRFDDQIVVKSINLKMS